MPARVDCAAPQLRVSFRVRLFKSVTSCNSVRCTVCVCRSRSVGVARCHCWNAACRDDIGNHHPKELIQWISRLGATWKDAMNSKRRQSVVAAAAVLLAVLAGRTSAAEFPAQCHIRLTVELTPDVPNADDAGFLSSLLSNHPEYRLDLLRLDDPSLIELELAGPGPEYLCQSVIETMRKDARVLSIRVHAA